MNVKVVTEVTDVYIGKERMRLCLCVCVCVCVCLCVVVGGGRVGTNTPFEGFLSLPARPWK